MALFILILGLVIEVALAASCFIVKPEQKKIKNYVRIGEFALYVIFTLLPVLNWSFQWKGLALLLAIKAVIAGISLIRKKPEKEFHPIKVIFRGIGSFMLIASMLVPAFIFPQYQLPAMTGTHEIGTAFYTYVDESRVETFENTGAKRELNVEFWYPTDATEGEKYPLVVFSHGAFGVRASNTSAYMELASNGYVVCSIDHPYHSMGTVDVNGKLSIVSMEFMNQVLDINNGVYTDEEEIYQMEQEWMSIRVPDMEFVLDTILEKAENPTEDAVYQMIDKEHIGLAGHSMGGATSAQVAREREDIDAVIDMEGTMLGEYIGFENGDYIINPEPYPVPILQVYTDNVKLQLEELPDYEFVNEIVSATAPAYYEVWIKGTNHMSLTDLILFSPFLVNMIEGSTENINQAPPADPYFILDTLNASILDFFNCYLKDEGPFTMAGEYAE